MTGGSLAQAAIHASTSSGSGAKLFDLDPLLNDEENVDYFVAPRSAQALSRNTKYYVVFSEGGGNWVRTDAVYMPIDYLDIMDVEVLTN